MAWYFYALIAAFLVGITTINEKRVLTKEHALEFSAVLAIANFLLTLPLIGKVSFNLPFQFYLFIFLASLLLTAAFLFKAKGLRHMDISLVSPLGELSLMVTLILAYLFLGERLSSLHLIGFLLLLGGAYIVQIEYHQHSFDVLDPFKHFLASKSYGFFFLSVILYGIIAVVDKAILRVVNPLDYIFWLQFFMMVNFLIWLSVFYHGLADLKHGFRNFGFLIFTISLFTVLSRLFYAQAVLGGPISLVIATKRLSNLVATLGGGKFFGERYLLVRSMACIIMIVGTYLIIFA